MMNFFRTHMEHLFRGAISILGAYIATVVLLHWVFPYFELSAPQSPVVSGGAALAMFALLIVGIYIVVSPTPKITGFEGVIFDLRRRATVLNALANALLSITVLAVGMGFYLIVFDENEQSMAEETRTVLQNLRGFATNRISNLESTDKDLKAIIAKIDLMSAEKIDENQKLELQKLKVDLAAKQTTLGEQTSLLGIELSKLEKLGGLRQLDAAFYEQMAIKIGVFIVLIFSVRFLGNRSAELRNLSSVYQRNADFLEGLMALKIKPTRKEAFDLLTNGLIVPNPIGQIENQTIVEKIPSLSNLIPTRKDNS